MSQLVSSSSYHPSSTTQDSEQEPSLSHFMDDVSASSVKEFACETQSNIDEFVTSMCPPIDTREILLTQAQQDFEPVGKDTLRVLQPLPNFAAIVPRIAIPTAGLFDHINYASFVKEIMPQPILPHLFETPVLSTIIHAQLGASLQLISTAIDDLRATTTMFSSTVESTLGEAVRSSLALSMRAALPSFTNMFTDWDTFILPKLSLPMLGIAHPFLLMPSFLPDMTWLTDITIQVNSLLMSFPTWLSFDPKRLKEWMKQRLIAVFKAIEFCFAPSMSEELMYKIASTLESRGKRSSITLLIWNYYARHNHAKLQEVVEGWQDNPEYARRWQHILRPALDAHRRGEYGLSISALAPLVEGISSHVVKKNMLLPAQRPRRGQLGLGSTESVILRTIRTTGDEVNLESDTTTIVHWLRVKSMIGYIENVFCENLDFENAYDHIHLRDHQSHRHGLLHGYQINAMTALNSLRLFLLLDSMHSLLQNYIARGGIV